MLSKTYYFILRGSDLLNNGTTPEKIALAIKREIGVDYNDEKIRSLFFEDLEKAKCVCRNYDPEKSGIVGIAELTLTILPTESEKNIDYATDKSSSC